MARSIADLPNSTIITPVDELNYLQEAYLDVYTKILEGNDDFYLKEFIHSITGTDVDPNDQYDFLVSLPSDFYRLRFIDYKLNDNWNRMDKFNPYQRNHILVSPRYRFKDTKLWIHNPSLSTQSLPIRISYYPLPQTLQTITDLIYPSEIAYRTMYLYMAISMKTKIGSDASQIKEKYIAADNILTGALNRDDNSYNQLNNFYNKRWRV